MAFSLNAYGNTFLTRKSRTESEQRLTIVADARSWFDIWMKERPPRERAARALCRFDGHPEDIMFEGKLMWMSYLAQADAVLQAVLSPEEWARVRDGRGISDRSI